MTDCREKGNSVELPITMKNCKRILLNFSLILLIFFFLGLVSVAATHNHFDSDDSFHEECATCQILSSFACFNVSDFVIVTPLFSLFLLDPITVVSYEVLLTITSQPRAPPAESFLFA